MLSRIGTLGFLGLVFCACAASKPEPVGVATLTNAESNDGWSRYSHAVELQKQGRTDAAVSAYREAEDYFAKSGDSHGSAVAIYGRAHTFDEAGRCDEAGEAYHQYADLMKGSNPHAAELAIGYSHECQPILDARNDDQSNGWGDYNRAVAFDKARRYNDSVASYTRAEQAFAHDRQHRALALYGRARALTYLARCDEASRDYKTYADLVRSDNSHAADLAMQVSRDCVAH